MQTITMVKYTKLTPGNFNRRWKVRASNKCVRPLDFLSPKCFIHHYNSVDHVFSHLSKTKMLKKWRNRKRRRIFLNHVYIRDVLKNTKHWEGAIKKYMSYFLLHYIFFYLILKYFLVNAARVNVTGNLTITFPIGTIILTFYRLTAGQNYWGHVLDAMFQINANSFSSNRIVRILLNHFHWYVCMQIFCRTHRFNEYYWFNVYL
jgi:hypothetical protein